MTIHPRTAGPPSRWGILLYSLAAGAMVANLYYPSPQLGILGGAFGTSTATAAFLVTAMQLGYTVGILLIVPLGDILDRRRLLSTMFAANVVALCGAGLSTSFAMFAASCLMVGLTSAAAMVIVPHVASIAPQDMRGRLVGMVMTGVLAAIPLSWMLSGWIAFALGWRSVYLIAAALVALLGVLLRGEMAGSRRPAAVIAYVDLLRSTLSQFARQPELRRRSLYGACCLVSFSALWTGLPLLLSGPSYRYPSSVIGLFGLAGFCGAFITGTVGRLNDRGWTGALTTGSALLLALAWIILAFGALYLPAVIAGAVLLNIAIMALHVTNQYAIYNLEADARSRITAVYMTANFTGATAGSAIAGMSFLWFSWTGLSLLMLACPLSILYVHGIGHRRA